MRSEDGRGAVVRGAGPLVCTLRPPECGRREGLARGGREGSMRGGSHPAQLMSPRCPLTPSLPSVTPSVRPALFPALFPYALASPLTFHPHPHPSPHVPRAALVGRGARGRDSCGWP
jgi:hypothetical protein